MSLSVMAANVGHGIFRMAVGVAGVANVGGAFLSAYQAVMGVTTSLQTVLNQGKCDNVFLTERRGELHKLGLLTPHSKADRVTEAAMPFLFTAVAGAGVVGFGSVSRLAFVKATARIV
jgi:hypothetical protein